MRALILIVVLLLSGSAWAQEIKSLEDEIKKLKEAVEPNTAATTKSTTAIDTATVATKNATDATNKAADMAKQLVEKIPEVPGKEIVELLRKQGEKTDQLINVVKVVAPLTLSWPEIQTLLLMPPNNAYYCSAIPANVWGNGDANRPEIFQHCFERLAEACRRALFQRPFRMLSGIASVKVANVGQRSVAMEVSRITCQADGPY
jgi:hypothetical protein